MSCEIKECNRQVTILKVSSTNCYLLKFLYVYINISIISEPNHNVFMYMYVYVLHRYYIFLFNIKLCNMLFNINTQQHTYIVHNF